MKVLPSILAATALASAAVSPAALAQSAPPSPPASPVTPRLASDVKPQTAYERVTQHFVLANPTDIFADTTFTSARLGQLDKLGQPVDLLARVANCDCFLVGRDGVGVGYISRGVLKPAVTPTK